MKNPPVRTPPKIRYRLTLIIPLALMTCVAAATLWELYLNRTYVGERVGKQVIADVTLVASGLEAMFERALRSGDTELIQGELASLGANRENVFAVLIDDSNIVLHSMRLADVGKPLYDVLPPNYKSSPSLQTKNIDVLQHRMGGRVNPAGDGRTVIAIYPLVLGTDRDQLRPSRVGRLILIRDYNSTKTAAIQVVARHALNRLIVISLLAIGLGLVFYFAIARRLRRLVKSVEQFGSGNNKVDTSGVGGSDEVARLAWAMDQMMADKAAADRDIVQSQQRLQAILEAAIDAIITIDPDGIIQSVNAATVGMFGYEADEILGRNVSMLMPAPYADAHAGYLSNFLRTGEKKIIGIGREVEGLRKSGTRFPIDLSVSEVLVADQKLFLGIVRDITDRKKAEEFEISLGRIVENSLNEIFIFDAETMAFLQVNRGGRKNIGYSMAELRNLTPADIKPQHTRESFEQLILPLITGAQEQIVFETTHRRKNGSEYDVEVHLQLTTYLSRPAIVAIILDITQRIEAAKALEEINEQLEQRVQERTEKLERAQEQLVLKEKLATLGQLAGGVAHEIRNPLGIVRNAAYYLEQVQDKADVESVESLKEISRGLNNAERIVSELLDFARDPANAERHPFPIKNAIDGAIEMAQIPRTVELTRNVDESLTVNGDKNQIERLLTNLLQNARQAMPKGGELTVHCESNGKTVIVKVCDNGVGIAKEELNKIFEPLYTRGAKGIGLGLALCRRYAELNNGTLEVASDLGRGSTFTVSLPKA